MDAGSGAHAYRATLRRYDTRAPWYDFVVCEAVDDRSGSAPPPSAPPTGDDRSEPLVAYCHDVAGAVFEGLSESDHDGVERSVMDAYLEAAEATPDRDRLCLALLRTMAVELRACLPVESQAAVLGAATAHLPAAKASASPLSGALDHLRSVSLLDGYTVLGRAEGTTTVRLSGYELDQVEGSLPTLPVSVELLRRSPDRALVVRHAERVGRDAWLVTLTAPDLAASPVSAPVRAGH
jgi:hypothetical protein